MTGELGTTKATSSKVCTFQSLIEIDAQTSSGYQQCSNKGRLQEKAKRKGKEKV